MQAKLSESRVQELETIIDSASLSAVLEALRDICYAKSQHVEENWQDKALARQWECAARRLDRVQSDAFRRGI